MEKNSKTPFLLIILLLLLLYSSFGQSPLTKTMPPLLYQGQQTVLALDSAHHWARKHIGPSVFKVDVRSFAEIQIFDNPEKTGKPLFRLRSPVAYSFGSAVVIADGGYLITNEHVINDSKEKKGVPAVEASLQRWNPEVFLKVKTVTEYSLVGYDGKKFSAVVVARDAKKDLALIQVKDKSGFTAPVIGISDEKDLADKSVIVIGTPLGVKDVIMDGRIARQELALDEGGTYSYIVSSVLPGNSGGPVIILSSGKIVGLAAEIVMSDDNESNLARMVPNTVINAFLEKNLPKK